MMIGHNGMEFTPFEKGYFEALIKLGVDEEEQDKRDITPQMVHPDDVAALLPGVQAFYKNDLPEERKGNPHNEYDDGIAFAIDRHGYGDGFYLIDKNLMRAAWKYHSDRSASFSEGIDGKAWVFIE